MKRYYESMSGWTAFIRVNKDGSATLKVSTNTGKPVFGKVYGSERAAKVALGRFAGEWREI